MSLDRLKKARDFVEQKEFKKALDIYLEVLPNLDKNSFEYAMSISEIGSVYFAMKDLKNAEIWDNKFHEICLEGFSKNPEIWREELAQSYSNLAFLNLKRDEFEKSLKFIDEALKLENSDALKLQKAGILKSISNFLFDSGNLKDSLALNEMAINLVGKIDEEFLADQLFFSAVLKYLLKDSSFLDSINRSIQIAKNLGLPTTKQEKFLSKIEIS
ncbi:tetratricopeptide repeat protein [Campylobacter corcagiensis]|uniref:Tetratricopeptide repeat protein n=1 Tax=Campylobacter corcagiensis TaxID=1448857 RepID=A0A7M1LE97_9BACT|nr:tetratricopeptide repeat protein [Campylobacter corcagiensis]QKF65220.1 hypothetical protein CCORG_1378 [Campylobacter corcagiensis]QOQ86643.1 tetratricopeptide repeat protein [Campylobacter corcagiensis]